VAFETRLVLLLMAHGPCMDEVCMYVKVQIWRHQHMRVHTHTINPAAPRKSCGVSQTVHGGWLGPQWSLVLWRLLGSWRLAVRRHLCCMVHGVALSMGYGFRFRFSGDAGRYPPRSAFLVPSPQATSTRAPLLVPVPVPVIPSYKLYTYYIYMYMRTKRILCGHGRYRIYRCIYLYNVHIMWGSGREIC